MCWRWGGGVPAIIPPHLQPVLGMRRKACHSLRNSCRANADAAISPEGTTAMMPGVYGKLLLGALWGLIVNSALGVPFSPFFISFISSVF